MYCQPQIFQQVRFLLDIVVFTTTSDADINVEFKMLTSVETNENEVISSYSKNR